MRIENIKKYFIFWIIISVFIVFIVSASALSSAKDICTDTDNGTDYYAKGICNSGTLSGEDYCTDSNEPYPPFREKGDYVYERYCSGEQCQANIEKCPNGCYKGACISYKYNINNFKLEEGYYIFDMLYIFNDFYIDGVKVDEVELSYLGGAAHTLYKIPCKEGKILEGFFINNVSGLISYASYNISGYVCNNDKIENKTQLIVNLDPSDSHWISISGVYEDKNDIWYVNGYPKGKGFSIISHIGNIDDIGNEEKYLNFEFNGNAWWKTEVYASSDGNNWTLIYYACSWETGNDCPKDHDGKKQIIIPSKYHKDLYLKFSISDGNFESETNSLKKEITIATKKDASILTTLCPIKLNNKDYIWNNEYGCISETQTQLSNIYNDEQNDSENKNTEDECREEQYYECPDGTKIPYCTKTIINGAYKCVCTEEPQENCPNNKQELLRPSPLLKCQWCGAECIEYNSEKECIASAPPTGYECKLINKECKAIPIEKEDCIEEGQFRYINSPLCCKGLSEIKYFSQNQEIISICTAKCGNGVCDKETESSYNCPKDCKEEEEKEEITCKNSCKYNNKCIWAGQRVIENKTPKYCSIDDILKPQKQNRELCQNNYECQSNVCASGKCIDVQKQLNFLKKLWCKIINLFDNKGYENCLNEL